MYQTETCFKRSILSNATCVKRARRFVSSMTQSSMFLHFVSRVRAFLFWYVYVMRELHIQLAYGIFSVHMLVTLCRAAKFISSGNYYTML